MSSEPREGWLDGAEDDYTEPLNQRGNKEVWTLKGSFDFVNIRVVIMFHECWVLLREG